MNSTDLSLSVNNSYSQALYELIKEENNVNQVENEVNEIMRLFYECPEFINLIKDPRNTQSEQINVIDLIHAKYGLNNTLVKFLKLLVSKRRLFFLQKILKDFLLICSYERGQIVAKLTAAKELSNIEIENIKNSLKDNFGSNLKLEFTHDPSLLGGLMIQVGSIMIDTSIKNKLKQIENNMIEV